MTKEDIKYIEDYLEWVRQNMNPAEVDFEHFANGMMNCNNILSQGLSLSIVSSSFLDLVYGVANNNTKEDFIEYFKAELENYC